MPEAQEEREPVNVPFASLINKSGNTVTLHTERPFRMLSTASDGPGFSWSRRLSGSAAAGLICRTFDSVTIAVTAQRYRLGADQRTFIGTGICTAVNGAG